MTTTIDKTISELIALGTAGIAALDRIPPRIAQECARRWLMDEARDAERAVARAVEEAATRIRHREDEDNRLARIEAANRAAEWLAQIEWVGEAVARDTRRAGLYGKVTRVLPKWDVDLLADEIRLGRDPSEAWRSICGKRAILEEADASVTTRLFDNLSSIIRDGVDSIIDERAAKLGIEWTAALLTTTIAMPDGTRVTWGQATRAQHAARLEMLKKHAATEIETATRHAAAIAALEAAGVDRLDDLA